MEERMAAITESANALGCLHLKDKQIEALDCVLAGKDTFVSLPTGYGKSIIFAALPLAFDKLKGISTFWSVYFISIYI